MTNILDQDPSTMTPAELRKYDEARADRNEEIAANAIEPPVHGGNDPDNMNTRRTFWGLGLIDLIISMTGTDREDAVCDAICDLLHAAHNLGQDPAEELRRAVSHFNAETGEGGL